MPEPPPNLILHQLSGALGVEICDIDVVTESSATTWSRVRAALITHGLLLFRQQSLGAVQMEALGGRFGTVMRPEWVISKNFAQDSDKVFVLSSRPNRMRYAGLGWHADYSFVQKPADLSWLYLHTVPDVGGDTAFANMTAAFEALSPRMQTYLESLEAVHDNRHRHRYQSFNDEYTVSVEELSKLPPVKHPVVNVHPQTGRRSLFVSETLVTHILDLPPRESDSVLRFLNEHCAQPEFIYRHRWQASDLIVWDNRRVNHTAIRDYDPDNVREGFLASGFTDPSLPGFYG